MQTQPKKSININHWFYLFLGVHLIAWTIVPALVRYNLPLDAMEGTTWGHQLEWGYDKNPYLNAWLTALAVHLSGSSGWMIYLFSQLSVIACFWAVWQLGKRILTPTYAFLSVVILEGIQYYHFHAIDFNDNTLELGLWALAIYAFYQATTINTIRSWLLTGLFAGLGMMAKYYTAVLLASMLIFLFTDKASRKQLTTLPPYLGLLAFLAITLPHVLWLFFHDFITVKYVFARASSTPSWTNHLYFPAQFAWQQLEVLFPTLMLFALLLLGKKPRLAELRSQLSLSHQRFLFYTGLGPLLLTLLLSLILGINLRAGWGMPILSLSGIILFALIQPNITLTKLYRFILIIYILVATLLTGYTFSLLQSDTTSTANFPGQEIANTITQQWHERYHTKLDYVAGSRWVGGNIGFYSSDHPTVFINWNKKQAPWINEKSLREKGAVFIWSMTNRETLPLQIQQQFPKLEPVQTIEFNWQRNHHHLTPIKIGLAFLPPN